MKNWHDMKIDDVLNELAAFMDDLHSESDRGCALIVMALIEERLLEILTAFFIDNNSSKALLGSDKIFNAPLGSLSTRLRACHGLGLITDFEFTNIKLMRDIRDKFAHSSHGITFESELIAKLCLNITMGSNVVDFSKLSEPANKNRPKIHFIDAAFILSRRLLFRSRLVAEEKRTSKEWKYEVHEIFDELTAIEQKASPSK